jgi:hypothetical protein
MKIVLEIQYFIVGCGSQPTIKVLNLQYNFNLFNDVIQKITF